MTTNRNSVMVLTISNVIKTGYIQDGARMADIRKFITGNVLYMLLIHFAHESVKIFLGVSMCSMWPILEIDDTYYILITNFCALIIIYS